MPTTTNVQQVKVNIMTEAQYEDITPNSDEFYAITDAQLSYNDLTNKPTIPTDTSDLTNGAGYITSSALSGYLTTSDIVSSVDSSSTNSKAVGAKLFYDTCGDIETLINAL